MKQIFALMLSVLILSLSAGGGCALASIYKGGEGRVAQKEECCCGCCCNNDSVPQNDAGNFPHKGCPFCINNTCPGFMIVISADMPNLFSENNGEELPFILHGYVPPLVNGIWQPPRDV